MINIKDKSKCCGCNSCFNICPTGSIDMVEDVEGFLYPKIDKNTCIECNLCKMRCPILKDKKSITPEIFGCYSKNKNIRQKSSSGGLFTILSKIIISENGIVYGAKFDKNNQVIHDYTSSYEELIFFRGSKYVQSNTTNTYKNVKLHLEQGKKVLFTGTPCQIAGLKTFLNKDYDNLICIDIICHSVPSPMVYNKYLNFMEKKYKSKIKTINFRNKDNGWLNYNIEIEFINKKSITEKGVDNLYMKGFLMNLYGRPSCTNCQFKNFTSGSDITLGDFWGIETIDSDFYDSKGVSLVCINTKKGTTIFDRVSKGDIKIKKFPINVVVKQNPSLIKSVADNKYKEYFYKDLNNTNINICKLIKKYTKVPIKKRLENNVYTIKEKTKINIKKAMKL